MRKTFVAVTLLLAASLSACATTEGAQEVETCKQDGVQAVGCEVTIQYKGKPLDCVSWSGSHSEVGITCDFEAYYRGGAELTWEDALATWPEEDLEAFYSAYGQQREPQ